MRRLLLFVLSALLITKSSVGLAADLPQFATNVPVDFQNYLKVALEELFSVKGNAATKLHQKIFEGVVEGNVYRRWFNERVRRIEIKNDKCNYTAKVDTGGEPGVIYISACVDQKPGPELKFYWLSILFHEARHLEPSHNHWQHDVCLDDSGGLQSCDKTHLAPYALEKIFSYNILHHCLSCSSSLKEQAREVYEDEVNWRRLDRKVIKTLELDSL